MKRHNQAYLITQGACNPSGIAISLVSACKECIETNCDQQTDPAVRLIVYQLASVCGMEPLNTRYAQEQYAEDEKYCSDRRLEV